MFSTAKKVAAAPQSAKAPKSTKVVETIDGLEEVAALEACAKAIKGLLDLKKDELKADAMQRLMDRGLIRKSRPEGLSLAAGDDATASLSIMKRSTRSPLAADELEIIAQAVGEAERDEEGAITAIAGFAETLETMPAMLAVNPVYAQDEVLLARIDKALAGIKGIPEDFILQIPAQSSVVVADTATDAVFRLKAEAAETVMPLIASLTMRAAFKDIGRAWDVVKPLIAPSTEAVKTKLRTMLKQSVA